MSQSKPGGEIMKCPACHSKDKAGKETGTGQSKKIDMVKISQDISHK